ncbi:MAG: hypothetical protein ACYTBJ_17495 [Planctomycetota bacterium]|jgi:hypothetical protein
MSKITIAALAIAAFFYAVWLVALRRDLPDPKNSSATRTRFILATLLFVGLLTAGMASRTQVTCYALLPNHETESTGKHEFVDTLKAVWRTLDPKRSEDFRNKLEAIVGEGIIRRKTANMLAVAFSELAYHKQRTRGEGPRTSCYDMVAFEGTLYLTRENAMKQIELLAKARQDGAIDAQTAAKTHAALAREMEMLSQAKALNLSDRQAWERLNRQYREGKIMAGDAASVASAIIVEMEDGAVDLTPAKRLTIMKERVDTLLQQGPTGDHLFDNDWIDPALQPNIAAILENVGVIKYGVRTTCYLRSVFPVEARNKELHKLQQDLLDKNVKAGVLDVELSEKVMAATQPETDYATEKDIQDYQKMVQRAVRLLYKRGELPSSVVKELEQAIDSDIISFNPSKALRNDMRYYFRSAFWMPYWQPVQDEVLKQLEKRKLIPAPRNHRLVMKRQDQRSETSIEAREKLAEFEQLIDGEEAFELPGDSDVKIEPWRIPHTDTEYRLKIRRVCRALLKTGLVRQEQRLARLEELIGIPILGKL